jgi:hypothetical protein
MTGTILPTSANPSTRKTPSISAHPDNFADHETIVLPAFNQDIHLLSDERRLTL